MSMTFAQASSVALPIVLVSPEACKDTLATLSETQAQWAAFHGFDGSLGQTLVLPGDGLAGVLIGTGTASERARKRFAIGAAIAALPDATYAIDALPQGQEEEIGLGYLLSLYRFDRYRTQSAAKARLVAPEGIDAQRLERIAAAEALARDLINTPAEDMGPDALEAAVRSLAGEFRAQVMVVEGADLLAQNFPLIHTVGRASAKAPRLIEMIWGESGPSLTLVGKGVCFDTGGLNLKPGASMGIMKKDMGGAANVLGLARMIMASGMDVQLRVLIPAVENNVAGNSFRPGDIFTARSGLTVEINNTDAEGRLVLADALALASETPPDLLICMATLTGAARVAVGPDIAPFFTDDEALAQALGRSANEVADPVWRLPFHDAYEPMIEPGIADLDNAPSGGMAGSITAALFLRRFALVPRFAHFDIYGWQRTNAPARPKGGVGQGIRALFNALPEVLTKCQK
ncbi:leucyl aminopeptidase family protein [Rhodobacteraceae bacterium N5(2021)]|uniref:Leucyl aminopeptidase family protein n=1 Tax=Gymnodinialimonas phycosphaerae TaxID=2841589 RepID=A0A975TSU5_9RHOB|nr:leucyl aminopeptidase family protein [Gymnodinialimonas phycosphaerae]MBY4894182.1 leucyl aminopeptidase family protein [Gymnodinialimonas phycosphaerae]